MLYGLTYENDITPRRLCDTGSDGELFAVYSRADAINQACSLMAAARENAWRNNPRYRVVPLPFTA